MILPYDSKASDGLGCRAGGGGGGGVYPVIPGLQYPRRAANIQVVDRMLKINKTNVRVVSTKHLHCT